MSHWLMVKFPVDVGVPSEQLGCRCAATFLDIINVCDLPFCCSEIGEVFNTKLSMCLYHRGI